MIWMIVLLVFVALGAYFAFAVLQAKQSVANSPRSDMWICEHHGPIDRKHLFYLDIGGKEPMPYCPICMEMRFKEAKGNKK